MTRCRTLPGQLTLALRPARPVEAPKALRTAQAARAPGRGREAPFAAPLATRAHGGSDPRQPCEGCPAKARCVEPCELLNALLSPEVIEAHAERSSLVVMGRLDGRQGAPVDEAFVTLHAALVDHEHETHDWPVLASLVVPELRAWVAELPTAERETVLAVLAGKERPQIAEERNVTRQSVHRAYHRARRTLLARAKAHLERAGVTPRQG